MLDDIDEADDVAFVQFADRTAVVHRRRTNDTNVDEHGSDDSLLDLTPIEMIGLINDNHRDAHEIELINAVLPLLADASDRRADPPHAHDAQPYDHQAARKAAHARIDALTHLKKEHREQLKQRFDTAKPYIAAKELPPTVVPPITDKHNNNYQHKIVLLPDADLRKIRTRLHRTGRAKFDALMRQVQHWDAVGVTVSQI